MNESKISVRYSKAIFSLSKEQNKLESVKKNMDLILETIKIKEFKDFLQSPIIPVSKKQEIFEKIFKKNVEKIVLDTILLMAKNRRENYLQLVALDYLKLYYKYLGITEITLTTATEISVESKEKIVKLLEQKIKGKIEIKQKIDPDIIGGFIVKIDDKQLDASVRGQLQLFRKKLIQ
jgi:F-type H+-transporting ATPase subunit delta